MNPNSDDNKTLFKKYAYAAGLGMSLCFEVLAAGLLGYWVGDWADKELGSKAKLGTAFFVMFFLGISLFHVVRQLERLQNLMDRDAPRDNENGSKGDSQS